MINLKRTLTPIRLAIPSLLALSATAAWTPTVTTLETGFSASVNPANPATCNVGYCNVSEPSKTIHFLSMYYDGSSWHENSSEFVFTNCAGRSLPDIAGPGDEVVFIQATDSEGGLAYAGVTWE